MVTFNSLNLILVSMIPYSILLLYHFKNVKFITK